MLGRTFPLRTGLDEIFEDILDEKKIGNYPPFNLYTEDNKTIIEIASTGFDKNELKVFVENETLYIIGNKKDTSEKSERNYKFRQLSRKNFERQFSVGSHEIKSAVNKNGILTIILQKTEPERHVIEIN